MDLRSLRYFIAVVDAGSLSKAAAALYVAQPALTAQVKKLEGELGAQLLERSHAGVTPTPVGLALYHDARRLLSDAEAMQARVRRSSASPEGSVTVAVPFMLVSLLIGPLLVRARAAYPRIRVFVFDDLSLRVQQVMQDGRADLGILVDTPQAPGLATRPLAEEPVLLCGAAATAPVPLRDENGEAVVAFDDAAALPLVLQSPRFAIRRSVERVAAERGRTLNVVHEHDSARVIRSLYLAGAGFTFTPASSATEYPAPGEGWLRARVVEPSITRRYDLATPAGRTPGDAARAVTALLVEQVQALVASGAWTARLLPDPAGHQKA